MNWMEFVAAPILVGVGGLAVWYIQSRVEEIRTLERNLHEDRRKTYASILDPYIRLFSSVDNPEAQATAATTMLTYEYRKTSFDLSMLGSDGVVRAYNAMMQFAFKMDSSGADPKEMMRLWGALLLEIRRSLGNPSRDLDEWDMLRGMIKDVDSFIGGRR